MSGSPQALEIQQLVFDLDDTLLDTYNQLIPAASREACEAMIAAGLRASLSQALGAWDEHSRIHSRREVFSFLIERFGVEGQISTTDLARIGFKAFYERKITSPISLFPGVHEMLSSLRKSYGIHLVTAGFKSTQQEKIHHLKLDQTFESIHLIDYSRGESKHEAFASIMRRSALAPECHLSIGNRLDTDLAEAKALGWKTCWVRYGEYANLSPSSELEQPDYVINSISELTSLCRL